MTNVRDVRRRLRPRRVGGDGLEAEHAGASSRIGGAQAHVLAVKGRLVGTKRPKHFGRQVMLAASALGVSAGDEKERRRVIDHDSPEMLDAAACRGSVLDVEL